MCAGCVTGFLKEMFPTLKSSGTPICSSPYIGKGMRPATTRFYKSEMWVLTPIQPPRQLHMLNTSETCAFSAHSFCSHPSTGHPHLSLVFLQDLPHQFLCLQSLSTHYFLYTVARVRFPKSNLTGSTILL